jgi:hypothetical protein
MIYNYSLLIPCGCKDHFDCQTIYNNDERYFLQGFIEVRLFISVSRGSLKRNIIHCKICEKEDDVLTVFPDLIYMAANHADLLD